MDLSGEPLGKSPAMKVVLEKVTRLIQLQSGSSRLPPILIQGETGTGKGFIAEFIHRKGQRSAGPFVAVNCAAVPEQLLEAEMFGFERGAFTDAKQAKPGLFQAAHRHHLPGRGGPAVASVPGEAPQGHRRARRPSPGQYAQRAGERI